MARPNKTELTPEAVEFIEKLLKCGRNWTEIYEALGSPNCSVNTIYRLFYLARPDLKSKKAGVIDVPKDVS